MRPDGVEVGAQVGAYRLVKRIGEGGMGTVWLAEHTLLGRQAAIKLLHGDVAESTEVVKRFFHEARAATAIPDPGIVQIFDFGYHEGTAYIAMEFLIGEELDRRLARRGRLPLPEALQIMRQVASTLGVAHAKGIVHRDLKPGNIFLVPDPEVNRGERAKVLDFGIAKLIGHESSSSRTQVGIILGTPTYMSPEQTGGAPVDARSDVYALGCVLFELLAGKPPFHGRGELETIYQHRQEQAPALSTRLRGVPPELDAVIARCLAKDPAQRFPSGAELAAAIDRLAVALGLPGFEKATPDAADRTAPSEPVAERGLTEIRSVKEVDEVEPDGAQRPPLQPPSDPALDGPDAAPDARDAAGARDVPATSSNAASGSPGEPVSSPSARSISATASQTAPSLPSISSMLENAPPSSTDVPSTSSRAASTSLGALYGGVPPIAIFTGRPPSEERAERTRGGGLRANAPAGPGWRSEQALAAVFAAAVPAAFLDSLEPIVAFFGELFSTARRLNDRAVRLDEPALKELESRSHFVLFLDDVERAPAVEPLAELSTRVFRGQVAPLAEHLATLDTPPGSILIAVLTALQLGQGARETIFTLRKDRKLFVVPIAASEIRRAVEDGSARVLLLDRIADLHTVNDPFAVVNRLIDPTRCIGFAAEVADLVKHIIVGGRLVSVAGPPGSGKTSVVAMAEYGCDTSNVARRFVRLPCSELTERDPIAVLEELHERVRGASADDLGARGARGSEPPPVAATPKNIAKTIMMLAPEAMDPALEDAQPARVPGLARRNQLVLVLEDADWLIRLASSAEPDAARREPARELWRSLARLCSSGGHTVIVTSIRDFQDQLPFERPVSVSRVPLRALSRRDADRIVTALGELVGFSPTRRALAALHRASGGNVYALRLLCSSIIRARRERDDYAPLARLLVTPSMVRDAVRDVAATGTTFRSHVSIWLDDHERTVLQHIARERPRSPRRIWRALEGSADVAQIEKALDSLEHMGLVESRRGRHRVRVPVLERWITTHLDAPPLRRRAIRQERISRIAIGCTATALLFGAYWTWLRSTRSVEAAAIDDCWFELDSPDRVGPEDTLELFVYQDCKTPRRHDLALEPVLSSLTIAAPTSDCAPTATSCTAIFKATVGKQAHDVYQVRLRVDGHPLVSTAIQKDAFASLRALGEKTVPAIAFLPLLLSVIVSFHKDMRRQLASLLHRGDPPDPPPAEPST